MSDQEEYISSRSLIPTSEFSQTCKVSMVKSSGKNLQPALATPMTFTPEFDRERGEWQQDLSTSSLTVLPTTERGEWQQGLSTSSLAVLPTTEKEESLRTPQNGTFDPFAPCSDKVLLAPGYSTKCTKYAQALQTTVVRRLNFEASSSEIDDDDFLLEILYGDLLEAIISHQFTESDSGKLDPVPDGLKTPISPPRLSGVAETCPSAPIKPANNFKNLEKDLCRKLEF